MKFQSSVAFLLKMQDMFTADSFTIYQGIRRRTEWKKKKTEQNKTSGG